MPYLVSGIHEISRPNRQPDRVRVAGHGQLAPRLPLQVVPQGSARVPLHPQDPLRLRLQARPLGRRPRRWRQERGADLRPRPVIRHRQRVHVSDGPAGRRDADAQAEEAPDAEGRRCSNGGFGIESHRDCLQGGGGARAWVLSGL